MSRLDLLFCLLAIVMHLSCACVSNPVELQIQAMRAHEIYVINKYKYIMNIFISLVRWYDKVIYPLYVLYSKREKIVPQVGQLHYVI